MAIAGQVDAVRVQRATRSIRQVGADEGVRLHHDRGPACRRPYRPEPELPSVPPVPPWATTAVSVKHARRRDRRGAGFAFATLPGHLPTLADTATSRRATLIHRVGAASGLRVTSTLRRSRARAAVAAGLCGATATASPFEPPLPALPATEPLPAAPSATMPG